MWATKTKALEGVESRAFWWGIHVTESAIDSLCLSFPIAIRSSRLVVSSIFHSSPLSHLRALQLETYRKEKAVTRPVPRLLNSTIEISGWSWDSENHSQMRFVDWKFGAETRTWFPALLSRCWSFMKNVDGNRSLSIQWEEIKLPIQIDRFREWGEWAMSDNGSMLAKSSRQSS